MKKRKGFQIGFSIYMLLLAGLCVFFLGYVWNTMEKFQSMQPDGEMKKLIKEITVEDMDFNQVQQPSAFEDENILKLKMQEKLDGAELSFEQRQGGYDAKAPVFDVYAGEELLYTVTLAEKEEVRLMAILSASVWETASIIPNVEIGEYQVDVTVPDNYTVTVNGITVEEGLCETVKIPLEELAYSAEYVAVPGLVSYHIAGLVEEPTVEIFDRNGEKVSLPAGERSIVIDSFPAEKMPEELFRMALGAAETYSNYFSVDLEGAKKSTAPIRPCSRSLPTIWKWQKTTAAMICGCTASMMHLYSAVRRSATIPYTVMTCFPAKFLLKKPCGLQAAAQNVWIRCMTFTIS